MKDLHKQIELMTNTFNSLLDEMVEGARERFKDIEDPEDRRFFEEALEKVRDGEMGMDELKEALKRFK